MIFSETSRIRVLCPGDVAGEAAGDDEPDGDDADGDACGEGSEGADGGVGDVVGGSVGCGCEGNEGVVGRSGDGLRSRGESRGWS